MRDRLIFVRQNYDKLKRCLNKTAFYAFWGSVCVLSSFSCEGSRVSSMRFDVNALEMTVGQVYTIELFIEPITEAKYGLVVWHSSDNSVATVDQYGKVTAVYSGNCTITASYKGVEASANVTVKPVQFDITFSKAALYFYGDYYHNGLNVFVVRLLTSGYEIEPDGNIVGAGYYANMELYTAKSETTLPTVDFVANDIPQKNSYLRGEIKETDGKQYASGSYLGLASVGSNSVILLRDGVFSVKQGSPKYIFEADLLGGKSEIIKIKYDGAVSFFDKTQPPKEVLIFDKRISDIENLGDVYGIGENIFRLKNADKKGNVLNMEFVAPISADKIPSGTYKLNSSKKAFSLVPSDLANGRGTFLIKNGLNTAIRYGSIEVLAADGGGDINLKISLVSADNEIIN